MEKLEDTGGAPKHQGCQKDRCMCVLAKKECAAVRESPIKSEGGNMRELVVGLMILQNL